MTSIEAILIDNGPMISSELVRKLAKAESISINTASQRVSREPNLERLEGFFKSNQVLLFLSKQKEDGEVLKYLAKHMEAHGKKYWFTLNAIRYHSGSISRNFLETYANYPIDDLVSHLTFDEVMQKFVKENILTYNANNYSFSSRLRYKGLNHFLSNTLETIKLNVLDNFKSQSRNIGLVSYDSGELFAEYGKFRWAFKGVCPLKGLKNGENFGFVLADILLGRPTYKKDVEFFLKKLDIVQSFKGAPRLIPILLVDSLDKDAFNSLKEKGIIIGFIKELFGSKYAETLNDLITILTNAAASLAQTPNKYLELIAELRKYNNGLLKNIKGALFEYVAGHYYIFKGAGIDMGWEVFENKALHEMDIRATFGDKVVVAECKGRVSLTEIADVNNWLRIKVPAFKGWIEKQEIYRNKKIEFEYWSSAGYTGDAIERIGQLEVDYKKIKVTFLGPKEIMERAKEMRNTKLQRALNTFFFKSNV